MNSPREYFLGLVRVSEVIRSQYQKQNVKQKCFFFFLLFNLKVSVGQSSSAYATTLVLFVESAGVKPFWFVPGGG